jgi:fatty acid-binding protein DegV
MLKASKGLQELLVGGVDDYDYVLLTAHMGDPKRKQVDAKLRAILKKQLRKKIMISIFPRVLVLHVGIGTYALMAIPKSI